MRTTLRSSTGRGRSQWLEMAKWNFEGNDKYIEQLRKLEADSDDIIKRAVYEGAGLVADAVKAAARDLRTDDEYHKEGDMQMGPRSEQKEGLIDGFGISKMKDEDGYINVKLGFSGTNDRGEKNTTVARQVEGGTSWMVKQPFIRQASNATKNACEQKMAQVFDEEIAKLVQ